MLSLGIYIEAFPFKTRPYSTFLYLQFRSHLESNLLANGKRLDFVENIPLEESFHK